MRLLLCFALCLAPVFSLPAADQTKEVSAATIAALIDRGGKEKPDWWDKVSLNYPSTLDLTCPKSVGWKPKLVPAVWMYDVVSPNPARWKECTKFWHFVLANAKQNKFAEAEKEATQTLAFCYGEMLQDWPRSIYWCQQADEKCGKADHRTIAMAEAYWRLESRTLAVKTLQSLAQDNTEHGSMIQLYAKMGDFTTAYALAKTKIAQDEAIGWFMTGYTAQLLGDWGKALDAFTQTKKTPQNKSGRKWKETVDRATAAAQAITLFENLNLTKIPDGTYKDSSTGYAGPITVEVTVAAKRITGVRVSNHREKQYYASLVEVPANILAKQHVKDVDATMGATITSEAIVYATAKALRQGQR